MNELDIFSCAIALLCAKPQNETSTRNTAVTLTAVRAKLALVATESQICSRHCVNSDNEQLAVSSGSAGVGKICIFTCDNYRKLYLTCISLFCIPRNYCCGRAVCSSTIITIRSCCSHRVDRGATVDTRPTMLRALTGETDTCRGASHSLALNNISACFFHSFRYLQARCILSLM